MQRNKLIYGFGHLGNGPYGTKFGAKVRTEYNVWRGMLRRCYSKWSKDYMRYGGRGITVCEEWRDFQNFADWYLFRQLPNGQLDKDILGSELKIYSPSTCCVIPQEINKLLTFRQSSRVQPLGVHVHKPNGLYRAQLSIESKVTWLGDHTTSQDAFSTYKIAKEQEIQRVAHKYVDILEPHVYDALLNYIIVPYPE